MNGDVDDILYMVEKAVDQHSKLVRQGEASLIVRRSRPRFEVRIRVSLRGSRKRPMDISEGSDDSVEEAALQLVEKLDFVAQAIK
jgi:hypothetical protein